MSHADKSNTSPDKRVAPQPEKSLVPEGSLGKRSGMYVRELRPNALWDAIKFIWQHRSDWIPWVAAGGAAMNGAVFALYQKLKGVPLDWVSIVLLFLFSLGLILFGIILGRRKNKEVPLSPTNTSLPQATPIAEPATPIEKTECTEGWLHAAAKEQAADISCYVTLIRVVMIDRRSESPGLDLYFHIRNKSLYHISIDGRIIGSIKFEGNPLSYPITVLNNELKDCLPLDDGAFLIKQPLTEGEAKRIFEYFGEKAESYFSLDDLNITIMGVEGFPQFTSQRLITKDIKPEFPGPDINKLKDRIKKLEEEKVSTLEHHRTEIGQLQESARTHSMRADLRDQEIETLKTRCEPLLKLAEYDKNDISRYVHIIFRKVRYEGLDAQLDKYLEIEFDIINASIYDIIIDKDVKDGAVYFNNERLNPKQTEIGGNLHRISRNDREQWSLVIKLWLSPELANRIKNPLLDDKLRFNSLSLTVTGANADQEVRPQRLHLPAEIPIETPTTLKAELTALKSTLEEERAKSAKPDINGEIKEVFEDLAVSKLVMGFDYFLTLRLSLRNRGANTNFQDFSLKLIVEGHEYPAERVSLKGYCLEKGEPQPGAGAMEMRPVAVELEEFQTGALEHLHSREGWLRFYVRDVEWDDNGKDANKKIELTVVDGSDAPWVFTGETPWKSQGYIRKCNETLSWRPH